MGGLVGVEAGNSGGGGGLEGGRSRGSIQLTCCKDFGGFILKVFMRNIFHRHLRSWTQLIFCKKKSHNPSMTH